MEKEYAKTVEERYWLDDDTCLVIFSELTDDEGDKYHVEAELHTDEDNKVSVLVDYYDKDDDFVGYVEAKEDGMSDADYEFFKSQVTEYYEKTKDDN